VPFGADDDPEKLFDALKRRAKARCLQAGGRGALGRRVWGEDALAHRSRCVHRRRERAGNGADGLSADCPPTLVVQHIRAGFVDGMIRASTGIACPRIVPAEDAQRPQPGHVYIAHDPENTLSCNPAIRRCRLKAAPAPHGHRPSVDALFESVAGRRGVAAALLTGMGADGAEGLLGSGTGGGLTIAQNEATCVVYGMPRVAVERGAAELVLPLDRIARRSSTGSPVAPAAGRRPRVRPMTALAFHDSHVIQGEQAVSDRCRHDAADRSRLLRGGLPARPGAPHRRHESLPAAR
jgi:hypothetical protein